MKIAILRPADYDDYFALRLASLRGEPNMYATDADAWEQAPRHVIERHLELSESGAAPIYGAWLDGALVAMIGLQSDGRPTVRHKATLWGFYVPPDRRRQGVGRRLLAAAVAGAGALPHVRQLRAVVNAQSTAALSLFAAAGFREFGREPRAKFVDGVYQDQVYFWFDLAAGG